MNRKQKILKHISINKGIGIEIGPLDNAIAPKSAGYNVHIIDHMNQADLREKYKDHPEVKTDKIEAVDFVWQGEDYATITGTEKTYDWIIASHVIEHTPDLINFLNSCEKILKDDGVLVLAVPDKRYCFDQFRPISSVADIIDSHLRQDKAPTPGTVADYFLNVTSKGNKISWFAGKLGKNRLIHPLEDAYEGMIDVAENKAYRDVHVWCFVPHSFRLIIQYLCDLKFITLKEVEFFPADGCEFIVVLGKQGQGLKKNRLEMLEAIESELQEMHSLMALLKKPWMTLKGQASSIRHEAYMLAYKIGKPILNKLSRNDAGQKSE